MIPEEQQNRVRNSLFLGAFGDALGAPIEFLSKEAIDESVKERPPQTLDYKGNIPAFTDDTQMTLFMAESLMRADESLDPEGSFLSQSAVSLVQWYLTQNEDWSGNMDHPAVSGYESRLMLFEEMHARRAPGNTCMSSCRFLEGGGDLPTPKTPINNSKGCGAAMRAAPYGWVADSESEAFNKAMRAGALTHGHPSGYLSAGAHAALVYLLCQGKSPRKALDLTLDLLRSYDDSEECVEALNQAVKAYENRTSLDDIEKLGQGWTGEEALAMSVFCLLWAQDCSKVSLSLCQKGMVSHAWRFMLTANFLVPTALWTAVAHGGDSDSVGAITGNLIGAYLNTYSIPVPGSWIRGFDLSPVEDLLGELFHSFT